MLGEKYLVVCRQHDDCIVYYNSGKECPLCSVEKQVDELNGMLDSEIEAKEMMTASAPGSF